MAWSRTTGLVYLPAQNTAYLYRRSDRFEYQPGSWNTGVGGGGGVTPERPPMKGPPTMLLGWDPAANREVWRVTGNGGHGGTLATAGNLVFWASGSQLHALDARTGDRLWSAQIGRGPGSPITYAIDGRQFVTIAAGLDRSEPPRVHTFALPL
jgi:quinohemoprotein ethanol dehydrogenase